MLLISAMSYGCPEAQDIIKEVFQEPSVKVDKVALKEISAESFALDLGVIIDNPNPIELNLAGIEYKFELDDNLLAAGKSNDSISVSASGKSKSTFPVSIDYDEIKSIYDAAKGQDELPYTFSGEVFLKTPIGEIPIPFKTKGTMPIVRIPKIKSIYIKDFDAKSLTSYKVIIGMDINNPNAFPLIISKLNYNLNLEGKDFTTGKLKDQKIAPKSNGTIKIPIDFDLEAVGLSVLSALQSGGADYSMNYDATYLIDGYPVEQKEKKSGSLKYK
jgi:LEA14-like dessication related protein